MSMNEEITQHLEDLENGKRKDVDDLFPKVYSEFKSIAKNYMRWERDDHTLSPTALVHEAWMKLGEQRFENRAHFFGAAAEAMRRILVESARRRNRIKRAWRKINNFITIRPRLPNVSCLWKVYCRECGKLVAIFPCGENTSGFTKGSKRKRSHAPI